MWDVVVPWYQLANEKKKLVKKRKRKNIPHRRFESFDALREALGVKVRVVLVVLVMCYIS